MKKIGAPDVSYEAYGMFDGPLYSLSVTENFADLHNAKACVKMLKRGGCTNVCIHKIVTTPAKRVATLVR